MRHSQRYTLSKRRTKAGRVVWYYRLRGEKTRHSTGLSNKGRAAEHVERILGAPAGARLSLRDFAADFFRPDSDYMRRQRGLERHCGSKTATHRQQYLDNWILPRLGDHPLGELTPVLIERWIARVPRAAQTRNHMLKALRLVLRDARRQGLITHNPMEDVELVGGAPRRRDALALEELHLLFPEDREKLVYVWKQERFAVAYTLLACTGMRVGEVCALLWRHISFEIPAVMIVQAVKADHTVGPPKNGRPRSALLPTRAVETLRWWRAKTAEPEDDSYVIAGDHGHLAPMTIVKAWAGAAKRAGIVTADRFLGAHALRHTYETRLRGRVPDDALRYMLGHQSVSMSEHYDQATPEERVLRIIGQRATVDEVW